MYLVDTSIWIHALRPSGSSEIQSRLKPLIADGHTVVTEWILLELMTGLPKNQEPEALLHWFAPVTCVPFDPRWWSTAWNHAARLRKRDVSPSAADCLIATVAMEHRLIFLHCDGDFEAMRPTLPLQTLELDEASGSSLIPLHCSTALHTHKSSTDTVSFPTAS